jgi:hypothetical protein
MSFVLRLTVKTSTLLLIRRLNLICLATYPLSWLFRVWRVLKATLPVGVRLLGAPANWLRKFVTRDPRYAFRQIFRDSMAAAMTTGADFVPVVQTFKDMATMKKTGALQDFARSGVLGGQVISGSTDDMGKILLQISSGKPGWESAMAKLDDLP